MNRSIGPAPRVSVRALSACAAALLLASGAAAQFGTIQGEQKLSSLVGGFSGPIANDYRFGVSVAELGDFDGDGIRDLVVGSHRADIGGVERGAIWLLLMKADGTVREHREISDVVGDFGGNLDDHDRFGISIAALGDLDLDGTLDLAVGAYRDDDGGLDRGCVYVLFLTPAGTVKSHQKISALSGGFTGKLDPEDSFGWSLETIGDLDGDGVVDLAVGATRDDGPSHDPAPDFGAVYVLFLNSDGTVKSHAQIGKQSGLLGPLLRPRDRFGADIAALGDADGDGVEDLAVGAFGEDPLKCGRVFVLHLRTNGTVKSLSEIGNGVGGFPAVLELGDRFGMALAADDFDGDGLQDLVIGAVGDDDGGADAGALYVCLMSATGRVRSVEKISALTGGFGGLLRPGDNFGISCATVGDLDRDGAVDLAVGAYQDDDGGFDRGASWLLFRAGTGAPVADFVVSPGCGEAPLTVGFADRCSGSASTWSWDFGDGTFASEPSPAHVYALPGTYDVTLTVQGPLGSDVLRIQRAVAVLPAVTPSADFSVSSTTGAAPLSLAFADQSTGSLSAWSWDFGDGTVSSLRDPRHVYETPGTYSVSLDVSGSAGSSQRTLVDLIHVLVPPPAAAFGAAPTRGPVPLTVAFDDLSTGEVTSWEWDFGDGTSSSARAPVHVYERAGPHDVTLLVRGPGGSHGRARPALIEALEPLASAFELAAPGGVAPVSVRFLERSRGGAQSWLWHFGDGSTSTDPNPTHVYRQGGVFTVRLTVTGQGTSATSTDTLQIGEPTPTARFTVSTLAGLIPLEVRFTDRSIGNVTAWEWDFGDGSTSTARNPVHVYRKPGLYTVRFRVHSAGGVDGVVRPDLIDANLLPRFFGSLLAPTAPSRSGSLLKPPGF